MTENEPHPHDPQERKVRLLAMARAIKERITDAEQSLGRGSWKPTWESINELETLFNSFVGDTRMLYFKNTGHVLQDGQLKRED